VPLSLAAETTTTTIPNLVGEPLDSQWIVLAGFALLLVIIAAGLWLSRRSKEGKGGGG
jgi:LPXTG-motif cell wall-anchored protein